jgi:hypothetical protein
MHEKIVLAQGPFYAAQNWSLIDHSPSEIDASDSAHFLNGE